MAKAARSPSFFCSACGTRGGALVRPLPGVRRLEHRGRGAGRRAARAPADAPAPAPRAALGARGRRRARGAASARRGRVARRRARWPTGIARAGSRAGRRPRAGLAGAGRRRSRDRQEHAAAPGRAARSRPRRRARVLYVAGEESEEQVRLRAARLGAIARVAADPVRDRSRGGARGRGAQLTPDVLIVDSIQTLSRADLEGGPGTVTQVRECGLALLHFAKAHGHRGVPGRPRHQGRRGGRAARARAHGGRGALPRGRALPALPRAARRQEPLRLDPRAGRVRDDRTRAWSRCANPSAAFLSRVARAPSRARRWWRASRARGRCWSRCRRWSRPRSTPRRSASPAASTRAGSRCCSRCSSAASGCGSGATTCSSP